jgi:hypothetical protein
VHAGGLVADEQSGADLAVGQPIGEQGENLDLAAGELEPGQRGVDPGLGGRWLVELEAGAAGERLDLPAQGPGAQFLGRGVGGAHKRLRLGAVPAGGQERLGLAPAGVGGPVAVLAGLPVAPGLGPQGGVAGGADAGVLGRAGRNEGVSSSV